MDTLNSNTWRDTKELIGSLPKYHPARYETKAQLRQQSYEHCLYCLEGLLAMFDITLPAEPTVGVRKTFHILKDMIFARRAEITEGLPEQPILRPCRTLTTVPPLSLDNGIYIPP